MGCAEVQVQPLQGELQEAHWMWIRASQVSEWYCNTASWPGKHLLNDPAVQWQLHVKSEVQHGGQTLA